MDETVRLTINGQTREFPKGISFKDVVKEYEGTTDAPVKSVSFIKLSHGIVQYS